MLRQAFLAHQPKLDPARTFFIDETGSTTAMAREVARSPRGERVHDEVPRNYGDLITIVGALTATGPEKHDWVAPHASCFNVDRVSRDSSPPSRAR